MEPGYIVKIMDQLADIAPAAWDALSSAEGSPFLTWAYLRSLEEAGCAVAEAGWQALYCTLWDRGGALRAAAPLYLKGNSNGEFVFDWEWARVAQQIGVRYYPKLIVAVPFTPAGGSRLLVHPEAAEPEALRRALIQIILQVAEDLRASSVHALFIPEAELPLWQEAGFLHRLGLQYHFKNPGYRDFEDFLGTFNSKRRHMLRRERAEVRKAGLLIETLRGPRGAADVEAMHRFYGNTVDKFFYGQRYLNQRFFALIAERMGHALEFVVARREPGGAPVAGAVNFRGAGRLYGRYWGQDAAEEARFLHFEVCYYHSIDECIRDGLRVFEPGAGGEHKRARGFEPTGTHSAHLLRDERLQRIIAPFLQRERAAVQRVIEGDEEGEEA